MPKTSPEPVPRDTSIRTYRARRDFAVTAEPAPARARTAKSKVANAPIFVVQKHHARRLHWDFRLQHDGVLWSWAVPRGPSLDPHDKRLAVRTEDHPLEYASFAGTIPAGEYGAGTVEIWDRGTWVPKTDPDAGIKQGELKFTLSGDRLNGGFALIRMKPRPKERGENWLLIKEHDSGEREGADAETLERTKKAPKPQSASPKQLEKTRSDPPTSDTPPAPAARRARLPETQAPQLATLADAPPTDGEWISEVKFDGYRIIARKDGQDVRLLTRRGLDWTNKLPKIASAVAALPASTLMVDGELVAVRKDGVSDFAALQAALSAGRDAALVYYVFDLLYRDGWDLRPSRQSDRKAALVSLPLNNGPLRYSDHMEGRIGDIWQHACDLGLEGIICKQADAPYTAGRNRRWLKLKCEGREEIVVVGFTPPAGSRQGLGSLHLGYRDEQGTWQYAGGVGSGFSDDMLLKLRKTLDGLRVDAPPEGMQIAGDPLDVQIQWVKPALIAEVRFRGWSGAGRVRHTVFLGLREDKTPDEIIRPLADPDAPRRPLAGSRRTVSRRTAQTQAKPEAPPARETREMHLTHPDRELWPGITKRDLAEYWQAVATWALPGIAERPLALVRCPDGIGGQHFFQKHAKKGFPPELHAGEADGAPYVALRDADGLIACAQIAAIELHAWGSTEADPLRPDRLVFDLDPGEGVPFIDVVTAAKELRARLDEVGLGAFCRTTGGKGLHVVVPLRPDAAWDVVRPWCRAFAEAVAATAPDRYLTTISKKERQGRILIDWLRNGLGSTAVASFSPRARPGATVATPLAWREVTARLDPARFTIATVPKRLSTQSADPWAEWESLARPLPALQKERR